MDQMPAPLNSGRLCPDCNGTGADRVKTLAARRSGHADSRSFISCWSCNGNGLDPAAYFRWSSPATQSDTTTGSPT